MGLFGFGKKKEKSNKENFQQGENRKVNSCIINNLPDCRKEGYRCSQYGLFNEIEFEPQLFIEAFEKDWGIKLNADIDNNQNMTTLNFKIDNIEFVCSFINGRYPDESPIFAARRNSFWREAEDCIRSHKSFMIIGILKNECTDLIKTCSIFTQVCCSVMSLHGSICMYNADAGFVIERNNYRSHMNIMQAAVNHNDYYLPYQNWVNINYVREEDGQIGAYTRGLDTFGSMEIELVHIKYDVEIMQKIIGMLLFGIVMDNKTLKNCEIIRLDEEIEILAKKDKGYYLSDRDVIHIFYS